MEALFQIALILLKIQQSTAFLTSPAQRTKFLSTRITSLRADGAPTSLSSTSQHHLSNLLDGCSTTVWTAAVDTFDGNQIVDPVVVSNVFWTSLQTKLLSVAVGQLLAAIVFGLLVTVLSRQMNAITDWLGRKLSTDNPTPTSSLSASSSSFRKFSDSAERTTHPRPPDFGKLLICLVVDVVGTSSEVVPLVGEVSDVLWAPVAGLILRSLYGSNVVFALEFAEEILPFTDFLPLATICWTVDTFFSQSDLARFLQIGLYRSPERPESVYEEKRSKVIDVQASAGKERRLTAKQPTNDD